MGLLNDVREAQIPLIAVLMLAACAAKLVRAVRARSADEGLGPTALFPLRVRRPLALASCVVECGLGLGLIVTAGQFGRGSPATCIRLGSGLMFLVATSALLELRAARPDAGCGCFGDFSVAPVSGRSVVRSAVLCAAAFATIGVRPIRMVHPGSDAWPAAILVLFELILLAALSPELREALVRLGYSEPCELRDLPAEQTLAALRRSKQWRRNSGLITADEPTDVWRELCWRYAVFPAWSDDRRTEVVFAIFLRHHRPAVHAAMVDAVTAEHVPWPVPVRRSWRPARRPARPGFAAGAGMPVSRDF